MFQQSQSDIYLFIFPANGTSNKLLKGYWIMSEPVPLIPYVYRKTHRDIGAKSEENSKKKKTQTSERRMNFGVANVL